MYYQFCVLLILGPFAGTRIDEVTFIVPSEISRQVAQSIVLLSKAHRAALPYHQNQGLVPYLTQKASSFLENLQTLPNPSTMTTEEVKSGGYNNSYIDEWLLAVTSGFPGRERVER